VFLERRRGEQRLGQATRVAVPLLHLRCGVAIAHQQQVDLIAGSAILHHGPNVQLGWWAALHACVGRIHHDRPDLAEFIARAALLDHHLHWESGRGEADAFGKGATLLLRLAGGLPLAVNAGEAAGIDHSIGGAIQHLEVVLPEIALVNPAIERAGPRALQDNAIEREVLLRGHAGVDIVQPQSPRARDLGGNLGGGGNIRKKE
jgi:hypothetical protein